MASSVADSTQTDVRPDHSFCVATFPKRSHCRAYCGEPISGMFNAGVRCENCGIKCHPECLSSILTKCPLAKNQWPMPRKGSSHGIEADVQNALSDVFGLPRLGVFDKNVDVFVCLYEGTIYVFETDVICDNAKLEAALRAGEFVMTIQLNKCFISQVAGRQTIIMQHIDPPSSVTHLKATTAERHSLWMRIMMKAGRTKDSIAWATNESLSIHRAAAAGFDAIIKNILDNPMGAATKDLVDNDGQTALHIAARRGNLEVVKALVDGGADLNVQAPGGITAFMVAAFYGHTKILKFLTNVNQSLANTALADGCTPLHLAAACDHAETVAFLLRMGGAADAETDDRETPLHYAAARGAITVIPLLIEAAKRRYEPIVNAQDKFLDTAYEAALNANQHEAAELLLHAGYDPSSKALLKPLGMVHGRERGRVSLRAMLDPPKASASVSEKGWVCL